MHTFRYYSFKVRDQFNLDLIASYFKLQRGFTWNTHLLLDNELVESVLKRSINGHQVYLYDYGVITYIGFSEDEMRDFLMLINQIESIDFDSFSRYYEHYELSVGEYGNAIEPKLTAIQYKQISSILAEITAKSVGLAYMEQTLIQLMDRVEPLLIQMSKGRVEINRETKKILGEIIAFKYKLTQNMKIFERPSSTAYSYVIREWYDSFSDQFELNDRYVIIENKIDDLKKMLFQYYTFNHTRKERRLYVLEVFLLATFPISTMFRWGYLDGIIQWVARLF